MYLRTTKRRNADGTEVRYYQLAYGVKRRLDPRNVLQSLMLFAAAQS